MSNSMQIIIVVAVVALLGAGGYYVLRQNTPTTTTQTNTSTPSEPQEPSPPSNSENTVAAATITYTDNGFSPAVTTVKSGDTLKIVNNSSEPLQMESDPHPVHTDDTELNVGTVAPGESKTFVLTTKGNWGFHNHLEPGNTARVNVE